MSATEPTTRLRGQRLQEAALRELADIESWRQSGPLTWSSLSARLNVTRQALEAKPDVVVAYKATQAKLKDLRATSPGAVQKRSLEDQVKRLRAEVADKQRHLDYFIERWHAVEAECRKLGINPDAVLTPLGIRTARMPEGRV